MSSRPHLPNPTMNRQKATTAFLSPHTRPFLTSTFPGSAITTSTCPRRKLRTSTITRASIEQQVNQQLKEAMKNKDTDRLKALRGIRAAFLLALKQEGAGDTLSDDVAIAQLRKLSKMRKESIEMYVKGGRDDLAQAEQAELDVIENWLPQLADREQTVSWAKEAIEKTSASKPGDMGKVMGFVMREHKKDVDGKLLKEIVSELLA